VTVRHGQFAAALLSFTVLAACAESNAQRQQTLRTRAAFDLKCPAESLKITELANDREMVSEKRTTSAGVEGCGQSRTYIYSDTQGLWRLDAVNGEPASAKSMSTDNARKEANQ
jgi:hypothetical protein